MIINFDTTSLEQLLYLPTSEALWRIFFWYFGWFPVAFVILWGIIQIWLKHRRQLWGSKQKSIILAIDIPRDNAQSLRAVENLFIYFGGAHGTFSLIEKWWEGKFQLSFSFEIVSIGGYIQFLIRGPESFRSLIESAIYSQYPDAEIYEVEDYTKLAPNHYPDEEYDLWGSEFVLTADQVLPIRTYPEFEHQFGMPETNFRDPMASLMDLMSSLQKGEQLWYQIIIVPVSEVDWKKKKVDFIAKILKEKKPATKANQFVDKTLDWLGDASEQVYQLWGDVSEDKKKEADPLKMMNLKPHEKLQIEGADRKTEKLGFEVSIRGIYFSRKEVMNKPKVVNGFVGYVKQFNTGNLNSLKPDSLTKTSTSYFFAESRLLSRKNKIMHAYKERDPDKGTRPWVLNVEELATLWHFPIDAVVKAPLIQRAAARRVEPPMTLPFGSDVKKANINREPIFDEGFEIEDEMISKSTAQEDLAKANRQPKFMDPAFAPSDDGTTEGESVSPHKGEAPTNLPFAD
jgi:hypothetical protein